MRKKLSAVGNSYGLVIEKPILELLNIKSGDQTSLFENIEDIENYLDKNNENNS